MIGTSRGLMAVDSVEREPNLYRPGEDQYSVPNGSLVSELANWRGDRNDFTRGARRIPSRIAGLSLSAGGGPARRPAGRVR